MATDDDLSNEFKKMTAEELEDEEVFFAQEGAVLKKKSWFKSVSKGVMKRSGSLTRMFGSPRDGSSADIDAARLTKCMACRSELASDNGGIRIQDPSEATAVRSVLGLMIRQAGRQLLKGQNVMNVSFPIECCQPRSILEIAGTQAG